MKKILFLIILLGIITYIFAEDQTDWTKNFMVESHHFASKGSNTYFILEPGYFLMLEHVGGDEFEQLVITVLDETKIVDGLETRVVEERESINDELTEISRNFYAFDTNTSSIFYFGEEVDIYENGKIVDHHGAWSSGKDGAQFGLMMPGLTLLGAKYYQEIAPEKAMDRAEIVSISDTMTTPAGEFTNCLVIKETTSLEPQALEFKVYASGIGLIKDENLLLVEHGFKK